MGYVLKIKIQNNIKMKIVNKIIFIAILSITGHSGFSQITSAGKSFYVDYAQWCTLGYPGIYINCGNDNAFNPGTQLTMEVWARAYTFGENRKIMGKLDNQFNNGYVLGFENLDVYSEIFNPDHQEIPRTGPGSMPQDSAWIHIATTYDANGKMTNYINGVNIGEIDVFPQTAIVSNTSPFIIGLAPWDILSYEFTGNLDEIRVWNVAKTTQEIKDGMFHQLKGNETGLIAYYNFDEDVDSIVHDNGLNHLNGILHNSTSTCFSWADSYAPVGDSIMAEQYDINASWYGKNADQYTYAITQNGLSLITSIGEKEFSKYIVFGHNNETGVTALDAPANAPPDFKRLSRVWYVNKGGEFGSQVVFNLLDAASGATMLTSGGADSLYTLLVRDDISGVFQPLMCASQVMGNTILFNNVNLENKYYTLCYTSEKLIGTGINDDIEIKYFAKIFPNPAHNNLFLELPEKAEISISDLSGRLLKNYFEEKGINKIDISEFSKGIYVLGIQYKSQIEKRKISIQ